MPGRGVSGTRAIARPAYEFQITPRRRSCASATGRRYTVQPGDSLSTISKQFYGNANQYMKIFDANKDKLADPDKVRAGIELVIP